MTSHNENTAEPGCLKKNLLGLSILAVIEGGFLLLLAAAGAGLLPDPQLSTDFLPKITSGSAPGYNFWLYRFFVVASTAIAAAYIFRYKKHLDKPEFFFRIRPPLIAESLILTGALTAVYVLASPGSPLWAKMLYYVLLGLSLAWMTAARRQPNVLAATRQALISETGQTVCRRLLLIGIPLFIAGTIVIPDRYGLFALIYSIDSLNHFDSFVMSPAWAVLKGATLNVDTFSLYGLGLPMLMAKLSPLAGGFSYENIITMFSVFIIIYLTLLFGALHVWMRNIWLAALGVFLALKLQVFSLDSGILIHPSRSLVRYCLDLPFFFFLIRHSRTHKTWNLAAAATTAGLALCYITDSGIHLSLCLGAYILLALSFPAFRPWVYQSRRDLVGLAVLLIWPAIVYLAFLYAVVGRNVFHAPFWGHMTGFSRGVSTGFGSVAWWTALREGQYLSFLMGCLVPLTYVLSLIFLGGRALIRRVCGEHLAVMVLCLYGLSLYHYHVWRPISNNVGVVSMPFVVLVCWWVRDGLASLPRQKAISCSMGICLAGLTLLLISPNFWQCPNVWNLSGRRLEGNKIFLEQTLDVEDDVALIQTLTAPGENACVISSYETLLLMRADRAPFFFHYRMVLSNFFANRNFRGFTFRRQQDLQAALADLIRARPPHIFISKPLFNGLITPDIIEADESIPIIMSYVTDHYEPVRAGKYLVALRRIKSEE